MGIVGRAKRHHGSLDIPGAAPPAPIKDSVPFDDGASLTDLMEEKLPVPSASGGKPVWIEK